jgi:hypothetical protein
LLSAADTFQVPFVTQRHIFTGNVNQAMTRVDIPFILCVAFAFRQSSVRSFVHPKPGNSFHHGSGLSIMAAATTTNLVDSSSIAQKEEDATIFARSRILSQSKVNDPPTLGEVRKLLPAEVFQVDTMTSIFYFGIDLAAVSATMGFLYMVVTSEVYHHLPMWAQAISVAPLQVLTGFAMWCMWCIG